MTFGPNGFFGYTPYNTGDAEATEEHLRGNATLVAGKGAFWWSRSEQEDPNANPDDEAVKQQLRKAHKAWKDPTIHKILEVSGVPLKIPTWTLPKLPTWSGKRVVLAGDAAHALPSSSGQGKIPKSGRVTFNLRPPRNTCLRRILTPCPLESRCLPSNRRF